MCVKGSQNRSFRGVGRLGMIYTVNEQRETKDIREKYELLQERWLASRPREYAQASIARNGDISQKDKVICAEKTCAWNAAT